MKVFTKEFISNFFSTFQAIKMCISQERLFKTLQHQQAKNLNCLKINPKFKKMSHFLQEQARGMGKLSSHLSKSIKQRTKQAFHTPYWAQHELVWQHICCSWIQMLLVLNSSIMSIDQITQKCKRKKFWSKKRPFSIFSLKTRTKMKLKKH